MSDQKMNHRRRVRVAGSLGVIALVVSLSAAACSSSGEGFLFRSHRRPHLVQ